MEKLPVIFRKDYFNDEWEVTAVFPTLKERDGLMTCYAHVGQHGNCGQHWYNKTKPATPEEYADLLSELKSIYSRENDPDAVELVVYKRRPAHRYSSMDYGGGPFDENGKEGPNVS